MLILSADMMLSLIRVEGKLYISLISFLGWSSTEMISSSATCPKKSSVLGLNLSLERREDEVN